MDPTDEQSAILEALCGSGNIQIEALAGTGKSTTLKLIDCASKVRPILYLAFNKSVVDEVAVDRKKKAKGEDVLTFSDTTEVRTLNSLGHRIWNKVCAQNVHLDKDKTKSLFQSIIDDWKPNLQKEAWERYWEISQAVGLAKSYGYVPEGVYVNAKRLLTDEEFWSKLDEEPDELTCALTNLILEASIQASYNGCIDFNDQVYMPALFGGTFPQFPLVLVDETQDFSPTNHAMLEKMGRSRFASVGDPWQSIYAFRGAKIGGMRDQARTFKMAQYPLSISFRCPSEIVRNVHWRVPHFKWRKEGGRVALLGGLCISEIPPECTFICRNNAPLFRLAFQLLTNGRSVSMAGTDIGPRLTNTMKKLGPESTTRAGFVELIQEWLDRKTAAGSKTALDLAACMRVFAERTHTLGEAIAHVNHIFAQAGSIKLMTGHKAKGLEFDTVYHLDPGLLRGDDQDLNLRYVISTRPRQTLFEINSMDIA